MKLLFQNKLANKPLLSIILLDWSCRESFHFLDYINPQTVPRADYEVIWIEYYDRRALGIELMLRECLELNKPPVIDKWIVMEMPKEYYYHKHLMYNTGILYGSGDIIVICDSDAIVKPTFVQSILEEFAKDPDIVLHLDQLRNYDQKYFPFNYPSLDEVEKGSANLVNGKPFGLVDTTDVLHNRNYGACFCAKREDVISIGGADEHMNYLGHICGPYEMTFRLINAGKKEKWHQNEWIYHVWHPGQAGDRNYVGPHDGRMMSSTALNIIKTKRIQPLVENDLIKNLRKSGNEAFNVTLSELIKTILNTERVKQRKINLGEMKQNIFLCYDHDIALYSQAENTGNPEISVILPSLRPEKARKCIDRIAETSEGVNYEVVVVSPLNMPELLLGCKGYDLVKFVKEEKKEGSCKANTLGYENASGKYVFAIADDHRLGQDCLKNLIEFMRPHDQEIFLAGARCCGVYGAAPECKTYGFYYAFNPCIRRDLVKQVGGFYDPYYKSYYGDPDLSMRVWHHGGRVELCPDAWVEFHNEFDDIDFESHDDYAERDFKAFFERWHPIYWHLVNSNNERDINVGNKYSFPGIPPEKCTRLIVFLRKRNWSALKNELESENNFRLNKDNLFYVLEDMLKHLAWFFIPIEIQQNLSKWLIKQLLPQPSFEESEVAAIFQSRKSHEINFDTEASNIVLAKIAMFFLVKGILKRDPEIILENYKGMNLVYSSRKYYAWPCSYGGFSIKAFKERADNFAFFEPSIYQAMMKIEPLTGNHTFFDWQSVRDMEDYFTSSTFERLPNDQNSRQVFEKLPDEICLKLMFCLRLKDWTGIEYLLNNTKENAFMMRYHISFSFVYGEILRNVNQIPSKTVLLLSQWLWKELYASSMGVQNITEEQDNSNVRLVVHGYRDFNIVYYKGLYYGWPWSAVMFSLANYMNGIASTAVAGKSPLDVKKLIDSNSAPSSQEEEIRHDWITIQQDEAVITSNEVKDLDNDIRLVVHGYRRYNIVYCKGLYYGWPWPAGRFSLMRYLNGFDHAAVVGKSIIEVKNLIDEKFGPPTAEEENQHDWMAEQEIEAITTGDKIDEQSDDIRLVVFGYRQYNFVHCKGLYFGWPWPAGGFTLQKFIDKTDHASVIAKSIIGVKKLIDVKLGPPTAEEENLHDWMVIQQNEVADKNV